MSFLSSLFGTKKPDPQEQFATLRDDGIRALQMGEAGYAEKCFRAAWALQHDRKVAGLLAEACLRQDKQTEALPILEELNAQAGGDALELSLVLARTQGQLKLYADERQTTEHILEQHADEPRALYLAGEAAHGLDEDEEALTHLSHCLSLRPDYHEARLLRGRIWLKQARWNEALKDAETLVATDEHNEAYLMLRAQAAEGMGHIAEAMTDYQRVYDLDPYNGDALLRLGRYHSDAGEWHKALSLYDEAIDLRPDFAAAYRARSAVRHHLHDETGAAEDQKRVLELTADKPEQEKQEGDEDYTTVENQWDEKYRKMNPYGF